jgi:hypothetical protein
MNASRHRLLILRRAMLSRKCHAISSFCSKYMVYSDHFLAMTVSRRASKAMNPTNHPHYYSLSSFMHCNNNGSRELGFVPQSPSVDTNIL